MMYSIQKQELIDYGNKLIADGYTLEQAEI